MENKKVSNEWFRKAAAVISHRAESTDKKEGNKWLRKAAEQGNLGAQVNLGKAYSSRQYIEPDRIEDCRWYRMAADQGSSSSKEKSKTVKFFHPTSQK